MILSKRERYIGITTISVLGLLILDYYILTPLNNRSSHLQSETKLLKGQMDNATALLANNRRMKEHWQHMLTAGLSTDASAAESQVLHAMRDWAQESGFGLSSLKPERTEQDRQFHKITFRATGTGTMSTIGQFLWRIQTAKIPVRISDMQINSRKEGTDDLSLQIGISTLYLGSEPEKPVKSGTVTAREDRP